jgi:predicted 2-oxoglutarate/Fe(II)-dependent dioxygenase YbiX
LGIQLNSNYIGGDYICYDEKKQPIYLSKEVGNVVAYNSDTLHEITEILSGTRYSLVIKVHTWELFAKNKKSLL